MDKVIRKYKLGEEPNDLEYWLTKTPEERLAALEQIRIMYFKLMANGHQSGFQRVYTVIKH